jgi:hypothetical protein
LNLDVNSLKEAVVNTLKSYLYPDQLDHSSSISLYSYGTVTQTFYPFSSSIDQIAIYTSKVVGSPSMTSISIENPSGTIYSTSSVLTVGWNTFSVGQGDLVSNLKHTIVIKGGVDASNDYYLGTGVSSSYYYGSLSSGGNLAFSIGIRDFIFKEYSGLSTLTLNNLPIITVEVDSRPEVRDRYLTGNALIEDLEVTTKIYSRFPSELDRLLYGIERGLVYSRHSFGDSYFNVTPSYLRPTADVAPDLFYRESSYRFRIFVSKE